MMKRPESLVPPISPSPRPDNGDRRGWDTANSAWIIFSHLLTGILLYAGIGWVLSIWLGHRPLLIAGGAIIGMFLAIYLIYRRLETQGSEPSTTGKGAAVTHPGTTSGSKSSPEARRGR